jgi:hypothetical protein
VVGEHDGIPLAAASVVSACVQDVKTDEFPGEACNGSMVGRVQAVSFAAQARIARLARDRVDGDAPFGGGVDGCTRQVAEGASLSVSEPVVKHLAVNVRGMLGTAVCRGRPESEDRRQLVGENEDPRVDQGGALARREGKVRRFRANADVQSKLAAKSRAVSARARDPPGPQGECARPATIVRDRLVEKERRKI